MGKGISISQAPLASLAWLAVFASTSACGPIGEVQNQRQFRIMAEKSSAAGDDSPFIDVNAHFTCLEWAPACAAPDFEIRFGGSPVMAAEAPSSGDSGAEEWCECVGGYELDSPRGLKLMFDGNKAVVEGQRATTANGLLEASLDGVPGIGWVVVSNSERIFTGWAQEHYFVDVAGGFELSFGDVELTRGMFFSIIPKTDEDGQ